MIQREIFRWGIPIVFSMISKMVKQTLYKPGEAQRVPGS
jgi:hypothetical protein